MEEIRKIIREVFEEQMKEQRYVAKMDFYVYANNDDEARVKSQEIARAVEMKLDNGAKIKELGKQPFGTLEYIPLDL